MVKYGKIIRFHKFMNCIEFYKFRSSILTFKVLKHEIWRGEERAAVSVSRMRDFSYRYNAAEGLHLLNTYKACWFERNVE